MAEALDASDEPDDKIIATVYFRVPDFSCTALPEWLLPSPID
jgi:hypothetical protein